MEADTLYKEQKKNSRVVFRENNADVMTINVTMSTRENKKVVLNYIIDVPVRTIQFVLSFDYFI